jgi:uncharacterized membrane protein YfcA
VRRVGRRLPVPGRHRSGAAVPYLVGGLAGGFIGGRIFNKIPTSLLHRIFGLLLLYGGIRSVLA